MSERPRAEEAPNPGLLEASLGSGLPTEPIFSVRAGFFVGFFGGPIAAILFSALNSYRLRRLQKDWPIYLLLVGASLAALYWYLSSGAQIEVGSDNYLEALRSTRLVNRGAGLLAWGAAFLLHRAQYRAQAILGDDPPSPWATGISCAAAGGIATAFIVLWLRSVIS